MKFIFSISLLVISGVLFFMIVKPLQATVVELRSEVEAYNVALDRSADLQKTRDQLVDKYNKIELEDRKRLERFLPNTANNIKFVLEIERIANLHNMPIKNIKFDVSSEEKTQTTDVEKSATNTPTKAKSETNVLTPYSVFPVEFTTEGDYAKFALFMKDLEHNLRLVDVKSISFAAPTPDPKSAVNSNIYTFNIKIETYWLK